MRFEILSNTFKSIAMLHEEIIISLDDDDKVSFSKIKKDSYDIKLKLKNMKNFNKLLGRKNEI